MRYNAGTYSIEEAPRAGRPALALGILGLAGMAGSIATHSEQFYHSYLIAYLFWLGIGLGGLFIVMLHHLTGSVWSVVLRRIAESLAMTIPLMALLFVPILFGIHDLYEWSHPEAASDPILMKKAIWLNPVFFAIRAFVYLGIWSFLAWRLTRISLEQDKEGTADCKHRFIKTSAPGMILFALTVSFAAFDWLMSLAPHWYSTIYGVYFAMGSIMAALATVILTVMQLQKKQALIGIVSAEHRHDLGKLLFAFMILWTYMAFSQYFLIWYANIPEETIFYQRRWIGSWKGVSLLLVFGHFVIPFFVLISRPAKRSVNVLGTMAVWLLVMHWIDLYWNVMPNLRPAGAHISPRDLTATIAIGGLVIWWFIRNLVKHSLAPVGDPKLRASINTVSK